MINKYICCAAKYTIIFAVTLLALWLLLVLSALIPNDAIRKNYEVSVHNYSQKDAFEFTNGEKLNAVADHYADSIWLNVAWNMGKGNPLVSSVQTEYYNGEKLGVNAGLYYAVMEGTPPNTDYTRYWHGTAMLIRLFHLFTDVEGIKTIGFVAIVMLAALSVFMLIRKRHPDLAVTLLLSLIAVHIWNIRLCLEYQPAFILALALIPLYLILERHGDKWLTILSVISGTSVAFFDFLTTETVTILLPLAMVIAVRAKENRLGETKQSLILLLQCAIGWVGAYAGTFFAKWIIASIVTENGAFTTALDSAGVHLIGGSMDMIAIENRPAHFFSGLLANLTVLFGGTARVEGGRVIVGLLISILIIFSIWYILRKKQADLRAAALLLIIGGVVLVRFLVLKNHSYVHEFFVYRALVTPIFAVLTAACLNINLPQKKRRRR